MGWQIAVNKNAGAQIALLDAGMRDELIEQVDTLAESPSEFLVRSRSPNYPGLHVHTYRSQVVPDLEITLYFDGFDEDPRRLTLVAITHVSHDTL